MANEAIPAGDQAWLDQVVEPIIDPERAIVDPHHHLWPIGGPLLYGPTPLAADTASGHNVVYHEFAHKLDMLDGRADGTPPLHGRAEYARWVEVCSQEYKGLRDRAKRGKPGLLDAYGATNEAEFFAVATEHFFDQPVALRHRHPNLYDVLHAFYRQDPAARAVDHAESELHDPLEDPPSGPA